MAGAKIYDLDESPAAVKRWTDLESVRTYYDFFSAHASHPAGNIAAEVAGA